MFNNEDKSDDFEIVIGDDSNLNISEVNDAYFKGTYCSVTVYFVKPSPVPSTETKKKTSKKGEQNS